MPIYQQCLSTMPINNAYQQCLSTIPINNAYQQCLSTMPINNAYQQCLSTMPINNVYQQCLSTMPINNAYQQCIHFTKSSSISAKLGIVRLRFINRCVYTNNYCIITFAYSRDLYLHIIYTGHTFSVVL